MQTYTLEERAKFIGEARALIDSLKVKIEGDDSGNRLLIETGKAIGFLFCLLRVELITEDQYVALAKDIEVALRHRVFVEKRRPPPVARFEA